MVAAPIKKFSVPHDHHDRRGLSGQCDYPLPSLLFCLRNTQNSAFCSPPRLQGPNIGHKLCQSSGVHLLGPGPSQQSPIHWLPVSSSLLYSNDLPDPNPSRPLRRWQVGLVATSYGVRPSPLSVAGHTAGHLHQNLQKSRITQLRKGTVNDIIEIRNF